jgi:hypothetical protein
VDPKSPRYGRMLEIKNIVNREIDGIPKKEYWVQMQLQMEVCDLDECDFLENKFVEYENEQQYWDDDETQQKGIIMYFHTKQGNPIYIYMPLHIKSVDEINQWVEENMDKFQTPEYNYVWIKNYYWKLERFSCVLVCRNKRWFKENIAEIAEIWKTIEKERVSGFEHRAPNRRNSSKSGNAFELMTKPSSSCLLQFNKDSGKITVVKQNNIPLFIDTSDVN